jgi:hypothetical protein
MPNTAANAKAGVTPKKLALIGVLGVIFVVVLVLQFGGSSGKDGKTSETGARGPSAINPNATAAAGNDATAKTPLPPWPKITLEETLQCDPFAMPKPLADKIAPVETVKKKDSKSRDNLELARRAEAQRQKLESLRSKGTAAIVHDNRGAAAVIGTRVVRAGDELDGFQIISIDDNGVLLAPPRPKDSQEDHP